jgi:hypothetical protein
MIGEQNGLMTSRAYVDTHCGKWFAWHDFAGGTTPTLYVTGECVIEIPGARVALRRAAAQGVNPRILTLDKVVIMAPHPRQGPILTSVRYDEPTGTRYTQVVIQPDDVLVDVVLSGR